MAEVINKKSIIQKHEWQAKTNKKWKHKTFEAFNSHILDIVAYVNQDVALTGRNRTGPPCSVTMELPYN